MKQAMEAIHHSEGTRVSGPFFLGKRNLWDFYSFHMRQIITLKSWLFIYLLSCLHLNRGWLTKERKLTLASLL